MRAGARLERLSSAANALRTAVLEAPGATSVKARRAAFDGSAEEAEVAAYVAVVRQHAYRVTEAQVSALRALGLSEDALFELTVAAAAGAAQQRLDAGIALLDAGTGT